MGLRGLAGELSSHPSSAAGLRLFSCGAAVLSGKIGRPFGIFFIFVFKKIKISKIYGGFEKFQNYTPVAPCLGDRGPVALWLGDRT